MKKILTILILLYSFTCFSQSSDFIKVHFLYGSKPKQRYKKEEPKWFGGKLGGHVGIEIGEDSVLNFLPYSEFHILSQPKNIKGQFYFNKVEEIWGILGGDPDHVKTASVTIPISPLQRKKIDSLTQSYINNSPYDYAFIGMRCGSSTYDILAKLGFLKPYSYRRTYWKIFYPRRLRKRIFKLADKNNWEITSTTGSNKRNWEKD